MEALTRNFLTFIFNNESHLILVTATVAVIGLFANLGISVINFFNLRLTTSVALMKQIQDFNLAVAKGDKALLSPLEEGELKDHKDDEGWITELYALFYQLNIVHDAWVAHKSWLLQSNHTLLNRREIVAMQAQRSPAQLKFIMNGKRGYPVAFKRYILRTLKELVYLRDLPSNYCDDIIIVRPMRFITLRYLLNLTCLRAMSINRRY